MEALPDITITLTIFWQLYLISSLFLFTVPALFPESDLGHKFYPYIVYTLLPTAHVGMVSFSEFKVNLLIQVKLVSFNFFSIKKIGSMYSTLAMSAERYIAVVYPFAKYR